MKWTCRGYEARKQSRLPCTAETPNLSVGKLRRIISAKKKNFSPQDPKDRIRGNGHHVLVVSLPQQPAGTDRWYGATFFPLGTE